MAMGFTGKQERNHTDGSVGMDVDADGVAMNVETRETGQTDWPVGPVFSGSRDVGAYGLDSSLDRTEGINPASFGIGIDRGGLPADGWKWDARLSVGEQSGEWSDPGVTANNSPNSNTPSNVTDTFDRSVPK